MMLEGWKGFVGRFAALAGQRSRRIRVKRGFRVIFVHHKPQVTRKPKSARELASPRRIRQF
jgi:hypothetical protein